MAMYPHIHHLMHMPLRTTEKPRPQPPPLAVIVGTTTFDEPKRLRKSASIQVETEVVRLTVYHVTDTIHLATATTTN